MKKNIEFDMVTTRGGDFGETSLYSGERRIKCDYVFDAVGDIDELNSTLGVVRGVTHDVKQIHTIQENLLRIGAQVATLPNSELYNTLNQIEYKDVELLESWQNKMMNKVDIPAKFILPGEVKVETAYIDIARTITRRCERRIVEKIRDKYNPRPDLHDCQKYLNRLSDYLFVLARFIDSKKR